MELHEELEDEEGESKPTSKFSHKELVYCRDFNGLLYLATIRRLMYGLLKEELDEEGNVIDKGNSWHYFVHFYKWSPRWDRWIPEEDVFEDNETYHELSHKLLMVAKRIKNKRCMSEKLKKIEDEFWLERHQNKPKDIVFDEQNKSLKLGKKSKDEATRLKMLKKNNICMPLPKDQSQMILILLPLKKILVDDWEFITKMDLIPRLPVFVTIKDMKQKFLNSKLDLIISENERKDWINFMDELTCYFDKYFPNLLYPQESSIVSKCTQLRKIEVYGSEYLLRLFVRLPALLLQSHKSSDTIVTQFCSKVNELIRFLNRNQADIFTQVYIKKQNVENTEITLTEQTVKKRGQKRKINK